MAQLRDAVASAIARANLVVAAGDRMRSVDIGILGEVEDGGCVEDAHVREAQRLEPGACGAEIVVPDRPVEALRSARLRRPDLPM